MTCLDAGLWSELQLRLVLCCLPGVRLSVICLLVSCFIIQWIKMQGLGHVENWKMSGIFSGEFSLELQPSHYTKPLLGGWLLSVSTCITCTQTVV